MTNHTQALQFHGGPKDGEAVTRIDAMRVELFHRVKPESVVVHVYVRRGTGEFEYRGVRA